MKKLLLVALLGTVICSAGAVAADGDFLEYQQILNSKCSQCHPRGRIDQAIASGADFNTVIEKMIRAGARISDQEQQVLGVFWRSEKSVSGATSKEKSVASDPLGEYRAVLASRCTGCHNLGRVEAAMLEGRSLKDLVEMMRKRGAIVTESDYNALAPFWGSPYKEK